MVRVFLDASVFFAACYSATGASREIINYAIRGQVALVVNTLVLEEVERNIVAKRAQLLPFYNSIREAVPLEVIDPTEREILGMKPHTAFKDAPHLATAKKANVACIVSLDRKHLVGIRDEIVKNTGVKVLLPEEFLTEIRSLGPQPRIPHQPVL